MFSIFGKCSYNDAIMLTAAGFAAKMMVVKVILIRTRLGNVVFNWPEDGSGLRALIPFLQTVTFAVPSKSKADAADLIQRLNAVEVNNVENESFLLLAMASWGYFASPPAYAMSLLYGVFGTRVIHNIALLYKIEPIRTIIYVPSVALTLYASVQAIYAALK